jgi:hypothetical protein
MRGVLPAVAVALAAMNAGALAAPDAGIEETVACAGIALAEFACPGHRPITVRYIAGPVAALVYQAGLAIDADGGPHAYRSDGGGLDHLANACPREQGKPCWGILEEAGRRVRQAPPQQDYYVTPTSLRDPSRPRADQSAYVDAETIAYLALPLGTLKRGATAKHLDAFPLQLGDLAFVRNRSNGKSAFALFADVGPARKIGEGSIALARALGIPESPRRGGAADGVQVVVFAGSGNRRPRTQLEIDREAKARLTAWGGPARIDACLGRE